MEDGKEVEGRDKGKPGPLHTGFRALGILCKYVVWLVNKCYYPSAHLRSLVFTAGPFYRSYFVLRLITRRHAIVLFLVARSDLLAMLFSSVVVKKYLTF